MSTKEVDPNAPEVIFINSLEGMLKSVGISKMYEAMDYFKLMKDSVYREVFNRQNPNNAERYHDHKGRQAFIQIFKFRYKQTYDVEYDIPINDRDAHNISLLLKDLEDSKIPMDVYLEWYFEDYVPKKNQIVEGISWACKKWVIQSFKVNNKDMMDDIQKKQLVEKERVILFEKAREIIRDAKFVKKDLAERIVETLREYNDSAFSLDELRKRISDYDSELKSVKTKI